MSLILSGTAGLSDVDGSAATPAIRGTDTNTGIFFPAADTIAFAEGGVETMRLDSAGNLGLGVTPNTFSVGKAAQVGPAGGLTLFGYSGGAEVGGNFYYDTAYKYVTTGGSARFTCGSNVFTWNIAPSGSAGGTISFTQAMTLDSSGNLGIGTTSPAYRLDVRDTNATVFSRGTAGYGAFYAQGSGTNSSYIFMGNATSGEQGRITCADTGILTFSNGSGATERARILSGGAFLIGTTSIVSGGEKLVVVNNASDWNSVFRNLASSLPYGFLLQYNNANPNNTSNEFLYASDSSTLRFSIRSNGGIANYQANNVNISDRREKTNFAPAGNYLAKICAIPVQTFNYIDQNMEEDSGLTLGVVAQDVQAVAPELVMESNWANKDEEPKMRLSIYQTDLQYALMKCIQEQQAIITQLQADVAALKAKA